MEQSLANDIETERRSLLDACETGNIRAISMTERPGFVQFTSPFDFPDTFSGETIPHKGIVTPLHVASRRGHLAIVNALLARGGEVDTKSKTWVDELPESVHGETALYTACGHGHLEVVETLIAAGAGVNIGCDGDGTGPLYIAASEGRLDVVKKLLAAGADLNAQDDEGATPLYIASDYEHFEVVRYLIAAGADLDIQTYDGCGSALFTACSNGHLGIIRELLNAGADVNASTEDGNTPLASTILTNSGVLRGRKVATEVAHELLCHGARPDAVNEDGQTMIDLAFMFNFPELGGFLFGILGLSTFQICTILRRPHYMRRMLKAGYDPFPETPSVLDLAKDTAHGPVDQAVVTTAVDAIRPWAPTRHFSHPLVNRVSIEVLLHVATRLRNTTAELRLPRELWLIIFSFIPRGWAAAARGRHIQDD